MKYFLCIAVLLLGGFTNADHEDYSKEMIDWNPGSRGVNVDVFTCIVASHTTGPLCSGSFIAKDVVVTLASCIMDQRPEDLVIYTSTASGPMCSTDKPCPVLKKLIHPEYRIGLLDYNLGALKVDMKGRRPYILSLLSQKKEEIILTNGAFVTMVSKYYFDVKGYNSLSFRATTLRLKTDYDALHCSGRWVGNTESTKDLRICVHDKEGIPFNLPFLGPGSPLLLFYDNEYYFYGINGNILPQMHTNYTYQAARGNYNVLLDFKKALSV